MASTYFVAIQDEFVRLRGTPFLLAATDFEISSAWRRAGIPLDVVIDTMRSVLEGRESGGPRVRGLKIIDRAVWQAWSRLGGAGGNGREESDLSEARAKRLRKLAAAVRASTVPEADAISAELARVTGSVAEMEAELQTLDRRLLQAALAELGDNWLGNQGRRAARSLAALESRLSAEQWQSECRSWVDEAAREVLRLPRLSLFG